MLKSLPTAALLACAVAVSLSAQSTPDHNETSAPVRLVYGTFDPVASVPQVPELLRSPAASRMWIVQFAGTPTQDGRDAVSAAGGEILGYLPDDAYVVRMGAGTADVVRGLRAVRWVGRYEVAYRLEPALLAGEAWARPEAARYNVVVADKRNDKPGLFAKVKAVGGAVVHEQPGSILCELSLTGPQLLQVAGFDEVLWIDRWTPTGEDMDNARIQGGGNYVETQAGYTGTGVNAHIYEGIEAAHQDFTGSVVNVRSSGSAQSHGHCTAGIVFGNGTSNPAVRGMAPDAGKFYTNYSTVSAGFSRYQIVGELVNVHDVSHTTASWGNTQTTAYTSVSAETDDIIFDHDIAWTQSQSNTGNQNSRPQAWAKNVFSIGGVAHGNDPNPANDSWQAGGASIGPAADGRLKPTLCAYYNQIGTSDRTGSAGYSSANWYSNFGGTSGATPIVAGHNVLAIEMFTDEVVPGFGPFGNALRVPGGTSHQNRPHFPTLKALQVVSAAQYTFGPTSTDNRREHQGWGFPDLAKMWDMRTKTFLVDETDVVTQGAVRSWPIVVAAGEPALKVCLNWADPAGNPAASQQLINNLSLRVTSPSGQVYWGNNGLTNGMWSIVGGNEDTINSIECVFVQNPAAGAWNVEVLATAIVQDSHVETPAVDADYALVVTGGTGSQLQFASLVNYGVGCPGSTSAPNPPCAEWNPLGGTLTNQTSANEYVYRVAVAAPLQVISFDLWTASTGGTVNVPANLYVGGTPGFAPVATATMTVGPTPGFYTATFVTPIAVQGSFHIGIDNTAQNVVLTSLTSGLANLAYSRTPGSATWQVEVLTPAWRVTCAPVFPTPQMGNNGLPQLGTTYDLTLSDALPVAFALLASGTSDTVWSGGALPSPLPGAPGCDLLVSPDALDLAITTAAGTASSPITVPNTQSLIGLQVFHQWAILDAPANPFGIVLSNAARATVGN